MTGNQRKRPEMITGSCKKRKCVAGVHIDFGTLLVEKDQQVQLKILVPKRYNAKSEFF
jgi:hypothetical protein